MSPRASAEVLRPGPTGLRALLAPLIMRLIPLGFAVLRRIWWRVPKIFGNYIVTRHDDVREVFCNDRAFGVVYNDNIQVLTGDQPFFLGLGDGTQYRTQLGAMQNVFEAADLVGLGERAEAVAETLVAAASGRMEIVSLVRAVTFGIIASYLGVPEPAEGRLDVWATRLFEFQFTGTPRDTALRAEVDDIAPAFRRHIDDEIVRRKAVGFDGRDVLGRCLKRQAAGEPGYSDTEIRTALLCMVVGGPPQPPMVVPQAIEQLLRRPDALRSAQQAATVGDDATLHDILLEAMRFDPLAPALQRVALTESTIAQGTPRATRIPGGSPILVAFSSAMMDPRRVPDPWHFSAGRLDHEYIHFGHGLHECFGRMINHATLHRMVKPLLRRPNLRRAPGSEGHLRKRGIFADRLVVLF